MKVATVGTLARPRTHGTDEDLPYGDWCRCARCGLVAQSTMERGFFAEPDYPLLCWRCLFNDVMAKKKLRRR